MTNMSLTLTYHITKQEDGQTLKTFIKHQNISKKLLVATKHQGGSLIVNGERQTVRYQLKEHDVLIVTFPSEVRSSGLTPYDLPLEIVYEDDYLLVINKPPMLPTIPSIKHPHQTLANAIMAYYDAHNIHSTAHFVNRLDKETSGLLVVAKYRHIHHLLTQDIKQIKRRYYALAKGVLASNHGTICAPIARLLAGEVKRGVRADGDAATTHYDVMHTLKTMTLVTCQLETGRTHQIRVHLNHLGHPIVGDTLYDDEAMILDEGHLLHSFEVSFTHPITKQDLCFKTDIPDRFKAVMNKEHSI